MTPLEEMYFNWLCAKVLSQDPHVRNYHGLMEILYRTEFYWIIIGDRNRTEDGCELRYYFLNETQMEKDLDWYESPCSVLEVLIAFAQRASFQTDWPVFDWFWRFLSHLGLDEYQRVTDDDLPVIQEILNRFMDRTFEYNGEGGILPLRSPKRDQRSVELWYQFCDYVTDQGIF